MKSFNFGGDREDIGGIRECIVTHRMSIAIGITIASGTKIFDMPKNYRKDTRWFNFVLNSQVHLGLRKAMVRTSYRIGTTSYFYRVAIGTIGKVLLHEGITRDTRCCPIVLGRQHDIVWPSQLHRIGIVFEKNLEHDGIRMETGY